MATQNDVRKICKKLPGAIEGEGEQFGFSVLAKDKAKGFCWSWRERVEPKKTRVINDSVLAVRVASLSAKEVILQSDSEKYFTEPHYNGYPAVLVRLAAIDKSELEDLLIEAWKCMAPKDLLREYDGQSHRK